jgi:UDP-2,4-diacetamido-2,4,6-trideoxy-beta-L-altropyranose hydrolase
MSKCSSAILSPSSVVYEYMSVGGLVFLHQIADNQKDVIKYFVDEGFAFNIKDLENINEESVEKSIQKQSCYFDGQSGERLKKIFNQFFLGKKFHVRRVSEADMKQCFIWASDPEVRFQSYNSGSIEYSGHVTWFNQKLNDPDSYFYILEIQHKPVAQIRFQVKNEEAVLGYLADKSLRSKGLGTTILSKGIEAFTNEFKKPINISGYVKKSNIASQRSFEKLSFIRSETNEFEDSFKYTMNYGN